MPDVPAADRARPSRGPSPWRAVARRVRRTVAAPLAALLLAAAAAACTESLDGGDSCPLLCPQQPTPFRDTVVDGIVLDTSVGPFPVLGLGPAVLLADRGERLQTDVVVRFDALPRTFSPDGTGAATDIAALDSARLRFRLDASLTRAEAPFSLELFDVDTAAQDSVAAVVRSLFREDRRITAVTIDPDTLADSVIVHLPDSLLLDRITNATRLRVGLRVTPLGPAGEDGPQLRLFAFAGGVGAVQVAFDPAGDTTYAPLVTGANTRLDGAEDDIERELAYTTYTLPRNGDSPPAVPTATLAVGGVPGTRALLRFDVPAAIVDSSTVVRAELVLVQRPATSVDARDTVVLQPLIGTANERVRDLYRAAALTAEGLFAALDSLRVVPADSGERVLNVVNLVRSWRVLPDDVPRVLVLRLAGEGSRGETVWFHASEGGSAVRPRLRLTYQPRAEIALP